MIKLGERPPRVSASVQSSFMISQLYIAIIDGDVITANKAGQQWKIDRTSRLLEII